MEETTAMVDIETGGFKPEIHALCEVGIIIINKKGEEVERYESLVKPYNQKNGSPMLYDPKAMLVNGLTVKQLEIEGKPIEIVISEVEGLYRKHNSKTIMAHNASFDNRFMKHKHERFGKGFEFLKVFCTQKYAKEKFKFHPVKPKSYSLTDLCIHFKIQNNAAHRSIGDCEATILMFKEVKKL